MYRLLLDEDELISSFYPLTLTRSLVDLKMGIFSIKEKWEMMAKIQAVDLQFISTKERLESDHKVIKANVIPPATLDLQTFFQQDDQSLLSLGFKKVDHLWDLLSISPWLIENDLKLISTKNSDFGNATINGKHHVIIGSNTNIEHCIINTQDGPVYIDDDCHVMDGAMLRGPISIGKGTVIKMGAQLYGGTIIGPQCVIGGEIKNSIFQGYSNKAHHGYIGNSYIGEWCNLGAGTSCSNLKNTLGNIKAWDISNNKFIDAGQKAGILMGDHVKTSINTSFNSGTVIGICANIFGFQGLTNKYIESFSWGGISNNKYELEKLIVEIEKWMRLKNLGFSEDNQEKIRTLYHKLR